MNEPKNPPAAYAVSPGSRAADAACPRARRGHGDRLAGEAETLEI